MFLSKLSYKQRKIFLGIAKEILITDDGTVDIFEEEYLRGLCQEMSLSYKDEVLLHKEQLKDFFIDENHKKILFIEIVALAYSNRNYHQLQKEYIENLCEILNFDKNDILGIKEYIKSFFDLQDSLIKYIGD